MCVCVRTCMHNGGRGFLDHRGGLSSVLERNSYETGMACYLLSKKVRKMDKSIFAYVKNNRRINQEPKRKKKKKRLPIGGGGNQESKQRQN